MDHRKEAVSKMKMLAESFLAGEIGINEYFPAIRKLFAPFDPLDWALKGMAEDDAATVKFFSEWTGGEFGETENRIPRDPTWEYGVDGGMYSWVDQEQYRLDLRSAYLAYMGKQ